MTDKQIIIDGIDVSGCSYYADGKCTNSHMIQSNCKNVAVCYYKEWQRKEQECEAHKMEADEGKEINAELKAENEELKDLNTRLDNQRETYWKEYKKLKQTLTEIKEIAENAYCLTNATNKDMAQFAKQILQKISEVENEN